MGCRDWYCLLPPVRFLIRVGLEQKGFGRGPLPTWEILLASSCCPAAVSRLSAGSLQVTAYRKHPCQEGSGNTLWGVSLRRGRERKKGYECLWCAQENERTGWTVSERQTAELSSTSRAKNLTGA